MHFMQSLKDAWRRNDSLVCVGLDPEPGRLPASIAGDADAIFAFCRDIVDATADLVCAYKPQIAHFAAQRAEDALERLIAHIHDRHPGVPVILDAKRGDIGSTARHYASEAFDRYKADAVTLNPYLGHDSIAPFLERADKGVILLCRTSNPGGKDFQALDCGGEPLYLRVAETIAREWNGNGNCALVTGATWPEELGKVRAVVGDMPLLVPGIGAQGGDLEAALRHGLTAAGDGLMISSSRAILYASGTSDFAQAARKATDELRQAVNRHRG
ncbi:orotidine-5'-phosphate decarboxylase [Luteibacter rhizovicinus]|uniref:Orotidine 5'-phosphate decarboxylase n=1 Tax=Luteibacter rhizovicinus TaxID=242606 RepID=A0A4V2W3Z2_9GAMM|nr:orotidine-5'-phosphate decarboxylase [Luteibacter rhizovicinus]TCV93989.1 orotidine-5'-phosphate decarboxylase [Luteibacter rhizovicinus]